MPFDMTPQADVTIETDRPGDRLLREMYDYFSVPGNWCARRAQKTRWNGRVAFCLCGYISHASKSVDEDYDARLRLMRTAERRGYADYAVAWAMSPRWRFGRTRREALAFIKEALETT